MGGLTRWRWILAVAALCLVWQLAAYAISPVDSALLWQGGAVLLSLLGFALALRSEPDTRGMIVALLAGSALGVFLEAIISETFLDRGRSLWPLAIALWWFYCCAPAAVVFVLIRFLRRRAA